MGEALGLDFRLTGKVFRQTNITLSRMAGIADVVVMIQHGHSSLQTTDIYTRLPDKALQDAAQKFAKVFPLHPKVGTKSGYEAKTASEDG